MPFEHPPAQQTPPQQPVLVQPQFCFGGASPQPGSHVKLLSMQPGAVK